MWLHDGGVDGGGLNRAVEARVVAGADALRDVLGLGAKFLDATAGVPVKGHLTIHRVAYLLFVRAQALGELRVFLVRDAVIIAGGQHDVAVLDKSAEWRRSEHALTASLVDLVARLATDGHSPGLRNPVALLLLQLRRFSSRRLFARMRRCRRLALPCAVLCERSPYRRELGCCRVNAVGKCSNALRGICTIARLQM